jgi:hypothetical protein
MHVSKTGTCVNRTQLVKHSAAAAAAVVAAEAPDRLPTTSSFAPATHLVVLEVV